MPIAPTLILGLGGTGSKIIERVQDKVRETGGNQSDRIEFVAFDTDINDLADIKRRSPRLHTVQTSTRSTVGEYLNINTNARDNWFPVNEMLNRKTLTEGAAQVRAISRLSFDTTLKAGNLTPLHNAVDQLFRIDKDQEEQALRVIITSSLAGGTGSGLILPVAMYLANFLRAKYPKAKAITRGFFIQPDVFYSVIGATEEQRNLQVNAYAAVRELDAFLMKGDNTLPNRYRDLKLEFPRVAAEGVEEVTAMPYDFCFLFDANNTAGSGLDSFAGYLDHAATCIYTQSLGPMSKRSNSREDNVLREVIKSDGRNRYAGAGASRMVYPQDHLRDYVAYQWADIALSKQWLMFDEAIKDRQEALLNQREKGFAAKDLDKAKEFIQLVDSAADNKDPFAKAVQSQCLAYDEEGISVVGQRWLEYVTELKQHVQHNAAAPGDDGLKRNAQSKVGALAESKDPDDYVAAYYDLKRFHDLVERHTEEVAGIVGYTLFQVDSSAVITGGHSHHLETYLREKVTNSFIHPVSARYFLYQTREAFMGEKQRVDVELDRTIKFFDNFETSTFDNPETEEIESPEEFATRKQGLREKLSKKPGAELQEMSDKYRNYIKRVEQLRDQTVYSKVLEEGLKYVQGLTEAFEIFFTTLDSNLGRLRADIELHRTKYDDLKGSTTRYVLADSTSLDSMYRSMPYSGGLVSVDSALSEGIYSKVRAYHLLTDEKDANYFQDLYNNQILGYFASQVELRHHEQITLDIIEALEREHRAREHNFEEKNLIHYVTGEINKAKALAAPFLEQPLGEERHPIQACAYNPGIEGNADPRRKALVSEHLGDYGGQHDPEISTREILFYNAIYGIRASDLSRYAPQRSNATDKRPAGIYFTAYHQLVNEIKPSVSETRVITPHIDRRWHTISAMPELDETYERDQLVDIHRALLAGLGLGVIVWETVYDDTCIYRFRPSGALDREFVVRNGTPCDKFYEVMDALTIDPVAVREITETVARKNKIYHEEEQAITFADSPFGRSLEAGLTLGELNVVVPEMAGRKATIFDVAAFYSFSLPREDYSEEAARDLMIDMLDYVADQISKTETDPAPVLLRVLRDQYDTFYSNTDAYLTAAGSTFARRIRTLLRPFAEMLEDARARDFAAEVDSFEESLRTR